MNDYYTDEANDTIFQVIFLWLSVSLVLCIVPKNERASFDCAYFYYTCMPFSFLYKTWFYLGWKKAVLMFVMVLLLWMLPFLTDWFLYLTL